MQSVQEIICPPPIFIEKGSITWTRKEKNIREYPFSEPKPDFKDNIFDLGPDVEDFEWVKQMLPPEHITNFWLRPTNLEGERLKKLADSRYIEELQLFGIRSDSKWRRWIPMTVEIFYAFWKVKLAAAVFG